MTFLKKWKELFLPKKIDFFADLWELGEECEVLIDLMCTYLNEGEPQVKLSQLHQSFDRIKIHQKEKLRLLNQALITPVDREAISRVYLDLYWISLSVKHLIVEIESMEIKEFHLESNLLDALGKCIGSLVKALDFLRQKKREDAIHEIELIFHHDNKLIKNYSHNLQQVLTKKMQPETLIEYEFLRQVKEVGKRIHTCGHRVMDLVFKLY